MSEDTKKIIVIILGVIILAVGIGLIIYFFTRKKPSPDDPNNPDKPSKDTKPMDPITPVKPPYDGYPCPPGWVGDGSAINPCLYPSQTPQCKDNKGNNVQCGCLDANGNSTQCGIAFPGQSLNSLRALAVKNGITQWPGILCPIGWTGNGTSANPCANPKASGQCASVDFTTPEYEASFPKVVQWASACNAAWPGVVCPKNWTGTNVAGDKCVSTDPANSNCTSDMFYNQNYDAMQSNAATCKLYDPMYSIGYLGFPK